MLFWLFVVFVAYAIGGLARAPESLLNNEHKKKRRKKARPKTT